MKRLPRLLTSLALALSLAAAALLSSGCATPAPTGKTRVVMQVSDADPARWNLALNNARNVQNDLGADQVQIEIVVYGPGIGMLKAQALIANRVDEAARSGIRMIACENTMTAQKIGREDMHDAISYVPAGVVQLIRRQQEGWAYIRP